MPGSDVVQSLDRGLRILEFVAESDSGLLLSELAARLQAKPSTVHNLARTLVLRGYLEKHSRPVRYRLGRAPLELAQRRRRRVWFQHACDEVLRLGASLPEATILVGEPLGGEIVAALRLDPSRPGVLERSPNWILPPYTTAVGLCFLAFWPRPERAAYCRRHLFSEYGGGLWGEAARLEAFLSAARSRGLVSITDGEPYRVAAPVFGASQELTACIGASLGGDAPAAPRRLAEQLIGAAAAALSGGPGNES